MVMTKTLALKGMYGLVGVGATVGSVFYLRSQLSHSNTDHEVEKLTVGELLEKVGLSCGLNENEELTDSKECSVKENGSINVKVGEKREEGVSFTTSTTQKLKVSKEDGYPKNLKFVVDSGDLELSKTGGTSKITKLEQFETYEIKREGGKFYLSRKLEAKEGKKDALGLPSSCTLPGAGNSECTLDKEEIKGVKFDNHSGGVTDSNGNVQLKISGVKDTTSFPENYKFTFTFPQEVTINNKKIKGNTSYDFKIKKEDNSNTLTLEPAWTADSLGKKVGLSCSNDTECTIQDSGSNLRVKQENKYDSEVKSGNLSKATNAGSGKIKVEKDQEGYNQGFKFKIEDGSINLAGSSGEDDGSKIHSLGEYETYEIKEESDGWYFVRKERADGFIKKQLNIGSFCTGNFPHSTNQNTTCNDIDDVNKLKEINFEGKDNFKTWPASVSGVQLEINKDTSLPGGFKFTFNSCSGTCSLPGSSDSNTDTNSGLMYKIKKGGGGTTLSLEPMPKNGK